MRRIALLALVVALAVPLAVAPGPTRAGPLAQGGAEWARLGPAGPELIVAVGVPPGWPADPLLLAARRDDLVRSRDAGATWERLPRPAERVSALVVAPPRLDGSRAAFVVAEQGLYRSADEGATWAQVLPLERGSAAQLLLSPAFARDGMAWLVADGALRGSVDGGASWQVVEPAVGQRVQQVAVSPAFEQDRTLFVAATTADFPALSVDRPNDLPATDHADSAGVLVSTDGGATWAPASAGLAVEGTPFRHVQRLVVSPTYPADGTLFAFAWGPREPGPFGQGVARSLQAALFRSRDRGGSWEPVRVIPRGFYRASAVLALSPTFGTDGLAILGENQGGISPASHNCTLLRGADGGTAWEQVARPSSYEQCSSLFVVAQGDGLMAVVRKGPGWLRSRDGGGTWEGFAPPDGATQTVAAPGGTSGPILVGATFGGAWAYGPGARATNGQLPCAVEAVGGFGRVWHADPWVRDRLGCPLAPEEPVRIRMAATDDGARYWTENAWPAWYETQGSIWSERARAERPWPGPAEPALDGAAQPFAGGVMLWLPHPDGRRTILVLAEPGSGWRELPD
jgi:photosystem II stability/assembly factor-like uncharacterized protein